MHAIMDLSQIRKKQETMAPISRGWTWCVHTFTVLYQVQPRLRAFVSCSLPVLREVVVRVPARRTLRALKYLSRMCCLCSKNAGKWLVLCRGTYGWRRTTQNVGPSSSETLTPGSLNKCMQLSFLAPDILPGFREVSFPAFTSSVNIYSGFLCWCYSVPFVYLWSWQNGFHANNIIYILHGVFYQHWNRDC